MKERPILMNEFSVKAILDDRKEHTRRVIKLKDFRISDTKGYDFSFRDKRMLWNEVTKSRLIEKYCPYGKVGDRLWVREPFRIESGESIYYKYANLVTAHLMKWKPSIFMPRWANRILLEIIDIRVERVQDITVEDCIAEGIIANKHKQAFRHLWNSINEKRGYGWDENPWVWVEIFKKLEAKE